MWANFVQVGDLYFNITQIMTWEWNEEQKILTLHFPGNVEYVLGERARGVHTLLDTLVVLRFDIRTPDGEVYGRRDGEGR